jgi:5'-nucleotidase
LLLVAAALSACGGDDDDSSSASPSTSAPATSASATTAHTLRILVTNDDGVDGAGIAALVDGLQGLKDVQVTVVAPASNKSGTGGKTSATPPSASPAKLTTGHDAVAVDGYPADAVAHGLDKVLQQKPHVVVSGINAGQNLGPIAKQVSGTVGAAKMAARRGVPALAVSQGVGKDYDYATGVDLAVRWVEDHRADLLAGKVPTDTVANLNVPSCATGKVRGEVEVPTATDIAGRDAVGKPADCTSTATHPKDDVDAFLEGYAPLSEVPAAA